MNYSLTLQQGESNVKQHTFLQVKHTDWNAKLMNAQHHKLICRHTVASIVTNLMYNVSATFSADCWTQNCLCKHYTTHFFILQWESWLLESKLCVRCWMFHKHKQELTYSWQKVMAITVGQYLCCFYILKWILFKCMQTSHSIINLIISVACTVWQRENSIQ